MIRIVKAATLAGLREQAALTARAAAEQQRAGEAAVDRAAQAEAEAARSTAEAAYKALFEDTVAGLSRLKITASDPRTGPGVQAKLALAVVRNQIAWAKDSGDPDVISGFQILDALLGQDITLSHENGTADPRTAVSDNPGTPEGNPS